MSFADGVYVYDEEYATARKAALTEYEFPPGVMTKNTQSFSTNNITSGEYNITVSSVFSSNTNYAPYNAFNDSLYGNGGVWVTAEQTPAGSDHPNDWIQIKLPRKIFVTKVSLKNSQSPKNYYENTGSNYKYYGKISSADIIGIDSETGNETFLGKITNIPIIGDSSNDAYLNISNNIPIDTIKVTNLTNAVSQKVTVAIARIRIWGTETDPIPWNRAIDVYTWKKMFSTMGDGILCPPPYISSLDINLDDVDFQNGRYIVTSSDPKYRDISGGNGYPAWQAFCKDGYDGRGSDATTAYRGWASGQDTDYIRVSTVRDAAWIQIRYPEKVIPTKIQLYNRPQGQENAGEGAIKSAKIYAGNSVNGADPTHWDFLGEINNIEEYGCSSDGFLSLVSNGGVMGYDTVRLQNFTWHKNSAFIHVKKIALYGIPLKYGLSDKVIKTEYTSDDYSIMVPPADMTANTQTFTEGEKDFVNGTYTISSSSSQGSYPLKNMFKARMDDNVWASIAGDISTAWVRINFPRAMKIKSIIIDNCHTHSSGANGASYITACDVYGITERGGQILIASPTGIPLEGGKVVDIPTTTPMLTGYIIKNMTKTGSYNYVKLGRLRTFVYGADIGEIYTVSKSGWFVTDPHIHDGNEWKSVR